jgi:hypothetical protein
MHDRLLASGEPRYPKCLLEMEGEGGCRDSGVRQSYFSFSPINRLLKSVSHKGDPD